jgi:hypothetical protein
MVSAIPAVAFQKSIDDVLGVGVLEIRGADGGQLRTGRADLRPEDHRRRRHTQEQGSAGNLHGVLVGNREGARTVTPLRFDETDNFSFGATPSGSV